MPGAKQKMKERCNGCTAQTNCVSVRTQQITLENLGNAGLSDMHEPCEEVCHFHCHWPIDGQGACWVNGFCFLGLSSMTVTSTMGRQSLIVLCLWIKFMLI